jgi:hypothetical protein
MRIARKKAEQCMNGATISNHVQPARMRENIKIWQKKKGPSAIECKKEKRDIQDKINPRTSKK